MSFVGSIVKGITLPPLVGKETGPVSFGRCGGESSEQQILSWFWTEMPRLLGSPQMDDSLQKAQGEVSELETDLLLETG
jgi:hypothetical protein